MFSADRTRNRTHTRRVAVLTMMSLAVGSLSLVGLANPASAATTTSAGPLTSIEITPDLNCSVKRNGHSFGEFFEDTACATLIYTGGGVVYGPSGIPGGEAVLTPTSGGSYATFTPVSQVSSGAGTIAAPHTIVTVVDAGSTGIRLTQTDSYVVGQEEYRTDVQVTNNNAQGRFLTLFKAGDCYLDGSTLGFGAADSPTGAVSCMGGVNNSFGGTVPSARTAQFVPVTTGSTRMASNRIWQRVSFGTTFPPDQSCDGCTQYDDNGMALAWLVTPPAQSSRTVSHLTRFSGTESLRTTKTADSDTAAQGAANGYTIDIANPHAAPMTLDSIVDMLPGGFAYTSGSSTGATTSDPTVTGQTLTWAGPLTIPADSSVSLHFGVTVSETPGYYYNSAGATSSSVPVSYTGTTAEIVVTPPPTVYVNGPYAGGVNSAVAVDAYLSDFDPADTVTTLWTYSPDAGVPAEATCSFDDDTQLFAAVTCTDLGSYTLTLSADDGHSPPVVGTAVLDIIPPSVDAGGPYSGAAGGDVGLSGTLLNFDSGDPVNTLWTYSPDVGVPDGATCSFDDDTAVDTSVTCTDVGSYTLTFSADDGHSSLAVDTGALTIFSCPDLTQALDPSDTLITGYRWVACPSPEASATTALAASGMPNDGELALLTTGRAVDSAPPNDSDDTTSSFPGVTRGARDVSILRVDLTIPEGATCVSFDAVFASEEYPEWVGSPYNDAFLAELDTSNWSVSGSDISAPNNFALDSAGRVLSVNSVLFSDVVTANGTQYDGATPPLHIQTPVTPGKHSLFLTVFDAGDSSLDSAVFLDHLAAGTGGCTAGTNQSPQIVDDSASVKEDQPATILVLSNDTDADGTIDSSSPQVTTAPSHGLAVVVDGTVRYTPDRNYNGSDSFVYRACDNQGACDDATVQITVTPLQDLGDFDGNGTTDIAVFRPSTGRWFVLGGADPNFGLTGDIPVPGDYDGNGTTDVAVYRPSTGQWFVLGGATTSFGLDGDVPVPGDYDGNGTTDFAVYRPSTGQWFVNGGATTSFGLDGDIPVPGDYDGNGTTDLTVYRPSTGQWFVLGGATTSFGLDGDIPVPGDYDGNGTTDLAVYRPSTGQWFVLGGATTSFGLDGDIPVPGDYDGNGTTDLAVFRPSTGQWYVLGGATTSFGLTGDIPLPLPYAIRSRIA